MPTSDFVLDIELIPATSFWDNVRSRISKTQWDKLRRECYKEFDYKCAVCQRKTKRLNCHETWHYFDLKGIQTLAGFVALCDMCHHVKHVGLAERLALDGRFKFPALVAHFMKVNQCTEQEFWEHRKEAFEIWEKRSRKQWKVSLGEYEYLTEPIRRPKKKNPAK